MCDVVCVRCSTFCLLGYVLVELVICSLVVALCVLIVDGCSLIMCLLLFAHCSLLCVLDSVFIWSVLLIFVMCSV